MQMQTLAASRCTFTDFCESEFVAELQRQLCFCDCKTVLTVQCGLRSSASSSVAMVTCGITVHQPSAPHILSALFIFLFCKCIELIGDGAPEIPFTIIVIMIRCAAFP